MDFVLNPFGVFARTVYCIGRNYAEHAKELGNAVPANPIVFLKPASSLCRSGAQIKIPAVSHRVDHEVEIVAAIGGGGKNISAERALDFISGFAVGIDVTARDLQDEAKKKGQPWTVAKGFDSFAPVSDFIPRSKLGSGPLSFSLSVNGELRQKGSSDAMIFSIPSLVQYLSTIFTLAPGDLIFTGTPAGVGPLKAGDKVVAELQNGMAKLEAGVA